MRCLVRLGSRRHEPAICGSWSKSVDAAMANRGKVKIAVQQREGEGEVKVDVLHYLDI